MSEWSSQCEVCKSLLDEEDLFCANCGTEAPRRAAATADSPGATAGLPSSAWLEAAGGASRVATHNFECAGCGASMSFDAQAGSLRCPFCGSVTLEAKPDAKILSPKWVVPFTVTRQDAVAVMRRWLGRGFFRPGDLSQKAAVVEMTPVYVPYWVFDAQTHTYWTADTSDTPSGARANWYPLSGEHHGSYSGLLVGASGVLSPSETSAICPFDLSAGVAPEQVDLDNITVEQFAVPRKYARPLARAGLEELEAQACQAEYVPGRARNVHVNVRIEALRGEPVLLPVWIMAYRYRDEVYRFLVNGQTGRATGRAPTSWVKIAVLVAAVAAVVVLVALLSGLR